MGNGRLRSCRTAPFTFSCLGGQFPIPATSSSPLLAFRCAPALRPYLPDDINTADPSSVSILVDTSVVFSRITNAASITLPSGANSGLAVTVTIDGQQVASGDVALNTTKNALHFSLSSLQPRKAAYSISCTGTLGSQVFHATGALTYLPTPPVGIGSVTKMDLRTGVLLARPANGKGGPYAPVFPIGFYTQFDNYLAKNLSVPAELKAQGYVNRPQPFRYNLN